MAVEKLKIEIEHKAKEELAIIKKDHEAQYFAIKEEIAQKSLQAISQITANATRECEEIAFMAKESSDLNAKQLLLLAREEAVDSLIDEIKQRIQKELLEPKALSKLFLKAKAIAQENFGEGYFVIVNKRDIELARKIFGRGVEIGEGANSGVIVRSLDSSINIDMQIDTLINSNIAELKSDIAFAISASKKTQANALGRAAGSKTNKSTSKRSLKKIANKKKRIKTGRVR